MLQVVFTYSLNTVNYLIWFTHPCEAYNLLVAACNFDFRTTELLLFIEREKCLNPWTVTCSYKLNTVIIIRLRSVDLFFFLLWNAPCFNTCLMENLFISISFSVQEPWDSFVTSSRHQSAPAAKGKVKKREDSNSIIILTGIVNLIHYNIPSLSASLSHWSPLASQWPPVPGAPASTGWSVLCRPHPVELLHPTDDGQTVSGKEKGQAHWPA